MEGAGVGSLNGPENRSTGSSGNSSMLSPSSISEAMLDAAVKVLQNDGIRRISWFPNREAIRAALEAAFKEF